MTTCWHCKAETPAAHYERIVNNKTQLHGDFEGWRMAGPFLIAPNGTRFTPRRLLGIAWSEKQAARARTCPVSALVVRLPAREYFAGQA